MRFYKDLRKNVNYCSLACKIIDNITNSGGIKSICHLYDLPKEEGLSHQEKDIQIL